MTQSGSITLPKELFDVEDPDTAIENILFTIEKPPDNLVLELRSKGHNYILNKGIKLANLSVSSCYILY